MRLFAALLVLPTLACSRLCPQATTLVGVDAGVARCINSTDCPRPSNILVCSSIEDRLRDCVECVNSECVRYVPEACP